MKASVIGATGFAGAELLRLLDGHPEVELAAITSESSTGENIAAIILICLYGLKLHWAVYRILSKLLIKAMLFLLLCRMVMR